MITVVLVEPEGEENVGAVARAMMNMDVERLVLVNPLCDHLSRNSLNYAVHAALILKNAGVYPSLDKALEDSELSAAVTRRTGQWRRKDFNLGDFSKYLLKYGDRNVKLVFGREKYGLTNDEIQCCDLVCSIPSSEKFPSINLAQAVMIALYDIYTAKPDNAKDNRFPASRKDFDIMIGSIESALEEMEFFRNVPSWRLTNYIKKILLRSSLDSYDCLVIKNIFKRIKGKFIQLKKC